VSTATAVARLLALVLCAGLLPACGGGDTPDARTVDPPADTLAAEPPPSAAREQGGGEPPAFRRLAGVTTAAGFTTLGDEGRERWRREMPGIRDVRISSRADDHEQPALWLPPSGDGDQPLLVVLHSWSNGYAQHIGIPFAEWAGREGWAMISPHFRGVNDKPQATGSDLAVQDVVDAVDFAVGEGGVDEDRVFLVGFSGGGMMSLLMAGRHPDRFAGAASWVPVHDLVRWYEYNARQVPRRDYADHIARSCRGTPIGDGGARDRCRHRSPMGHLDRARRAGVPVYIGHGHADTLVTPDHALRAYNQLVAPSDRLGMRTLERVADNELPGHLRSVEPGHHFGPRDPQVLFSRTTGPATIVLFRGEHDMVYHPALSWMWRLAWEGDGGRDRR
jgi:poly(3-hydroxybutyrate) depolymerase